MQKTCKFSGTEQVKKNVVSILFDCFSGQKYWGSSSYNVCGIWIPISTSPNVSIVMQLPDFPSGGPYDPPWYMGVSLDCAPKIFSFFCFFLFFPYSLFLIFSPMGSPHETKLPFHNFSFYFLGTKKKPLMSQLLILVISSTSVFLDRGSSFHLNAPQSHGCGPGTTKFSL